MKSQHLTRVALFVLLTFGICIAAAGYIDIPIHKLGMGKVAESNEQYLKDSLDNSVTGFLVLSGIKTGLAIIEGSEVGIGFNLELGDIVQAVYDYVDIAWKTALAGGTVILLTRLVLKAVALVDHWCLALTLFSVIVYLVVKWFFPRRNRLFRLTREATFFLVLFSVVFYLIFPFSISAAAFLSGKITAPLIRESQKSFESIQDELTVDNINRRLFPDDLKKNEGWFSDLDVKSKIAEIREHLREQSDYFKDKTRNIAIWTLQLIAGYLFDSIVFPITFFILLFVVTKGALVYLFEERKYQSFKEDISEIARKFYERDQQKPDKRIGRVRLTRRLPGFDRSRARRRDKQL